MMKKIIASFLITLISFIPTTYSYADEPVTIDIEVRFVQHSQCPTLYHTNVNHLIDYVNEFYFSNYDITLNLVGTSVIINDEMFYLADNGESPDLVAYNEFPKQKEKDRLVLLINRNDCNYVGLGWEKVMLINEEFLYGTTFIHEFGHAFGLEHEMEDMFNYMYPKGNPFQSYLNEKQIKKMKNEILNGYAK